MTGLNADHFAAYSPDKWSSNVHNLPRMRVKDAMLALCDRAQKGLEAELEGLSRAASDEVPNIINQKKVDAQWVYWFRNPKARESLASFLGGTPLNEQALFNIAPQDKHIVLAIVLRQEGLWVGLRLAPGASVDRRNLAAMLGRSWERDRLAELIAELPPGAMVAQASLQLDAEGLSGAALADLAAALSHQHPPLEIGHHLPAQDAINLGADLADYLGRWLGSLTPIYEFVAWTQENDKIDAGKQIQEEKAQKRRQAQSLKSGDKVRITAGLFSGKLGTVEGIDTKSQVRVRVGKMSVVVPGKDVVRAV